MNKTIKVIAATLLLMVAIPTTKLSAETVGDKITGTLSQSFAKKGAGVANITLTHNGKNVGINPSRILVGNPMAEVKSVNHSYSFVANKPGTYVVKLDFEQMASADTGGKLWETLPASVSRTHYVSKKETVVTTETIVVDTIVNKYTTKQVKTNKLYVGNSRVVQKGVNGKIQKTEIVTYSDGVETSRKAGPDKVVQTMVQEIVEIGTKVKETQPKPDNKPQPDKKPVIGKEPQPEKRPTDNSYKDNVEPEKDKDKINIDYSNVIKSVKITWGTDELEMTPKFNSDVYTYQIVKSPKADTVNFKVEYDDMNGLVEVNYSEKVDLNENNSPRIEIYGEERLALGYEFNFVDKDKIIKEYKVKGQSLYLTEDLVLQNDIYELKGLGLEQNDLGYFELENGRELGILTTDYTEELLESANWWVFVDGEPAYDVEPIVINDELHLLSTNKKTKEAFDRRADNQDIGVKFYPYFITTGPKIETSPVYGYIIEDEVITLAYDRDNIEVFIGVDTKEDKIRVIDVEELDKAEEKDMNKLKTILIVVGVLVGLIAVTLTGMLIKEKIDDKKRLENWKKNKENKKE